MERYTLYGGGGSPYSMKMRAILRYRRIPHNWVLVSPQLRTTLKHEGPPVIPILQLPEDGSLHVDSTPLAMMLEERHTGRAIIPDDPDVAYPSDLIEDMGDEGQRGYNTQAYSTREIVRIAHVAFDLARKRGKRVCSVDKANVMGSGVVWREETTLLRDAHYQDVDLNHMFIDNCSMQLVRAPKQFDVILTDNLFGDILSDLAAMLTGSLGMLPSASLGATGDDGRQPALYEPVHGSAPDIAGQNKGNPLAQILSLSMMLRYSFDMAEQADLIESAVEAVLTKNIRTGDIAGDGMTPVSTIEMGDAVLAELAALAS